jgi:hypothetical protein
VQARVDHLVGCGWFWAWALVGCGAALGAISLGPLLELPILGVGIALASSPRVRQSAFGLLSGAGAVCLLVAWLQRRGPGTVCWQKANAAGCDQYLDPRPWLAIGILLLVGGLVGHAVRSRPDG